VVKLPEKDPTGELGKAMALDKADELFRRDLTVVDLRDPRRPMLRLTETARQELERLKKSKNRGEDA
jgi:cell division protein FtsQ